MKVLIIQPVIPSYSDSFFNLIACDARIKLSVMADIHTTNTLNQVDAENSLYKIIPSKLLKMGPLTFHRDLFKYLIKNFFAYDLVVFSGNPRDPIQLLLMFIMRILGRKFYVWSSFMRIGERKISTDIYFYISAALSNICLCYSRVGALRLKDLGIRKSKIKILGTAINQHSVHVDELKPSEKIEWLDKYMLSGKKVVLQVVRLSRIKRPDIILQAAKEICHVRNMDVAFILIGEGELYEEIKRKISAMGLSKSVFLLGSIYNEEVLSKWFNVSSAFLVPTCIGLSLHHAMAYGCIVITDDSYDCQAPEFELLINGLNGFTYREGDVDSLVEKITHVLNNPIEMQFISNNAKHTIHEINTIEQKADNFIRFATEYNAKN